MCPKTTNFKTKYYYEMGLLNVTKCNKCNQVIFYVSSGKPVFRVWLKR